MNQANITIASLVVSISLILLSSTGPLETARGKMQNLFLPLSKGSYQSINQSQSLFGTITRIKDLSRENSQLKFDNESLQAKVVELEEVRYRNSILEKELGIRSNDTDLKFTTAAVVGRSPSSFRDILTIDKGEEDGIKVNQPVMASGSLIGKINKVFPRSAQIELITSHRFLVPVVLQDTRSLGLLKGGLKGLVVEQLPIDSKINIGEPIVTSGLAGEMPAGLPIGKVSTVISENSDIFNTVTVESPVNFGRVEIVLVLLGS